jgi:hypothetical protein
MTHHQIGDRVKCFGVECVIVSVFLNDSADVAYVVRDPQNRTHYKDSGEILKWNC